MIWEIEEDFDISTEAPSVEEMYQAIKKMKSGEAPGKDEITAKMLKGVGMEIFYVLCQIFSKIWETKSQPMSGRPALL